mmetsp:Transcript_2115/g.4790  ORF Transcript_2115/g.4790 Transcript_2115/m.4790 type:complete len:214 (+) Transcript_2115:1654-2295(+)
MATEPSPPSPLPTASSSLASSSAVTMLKLATLKALKSSSSASSQSSVLPHSFCSSSDLSSRRSRAASSYTIRPDPGACACERPWGACADGSACEGSLALGSWEDPRCVPGAPALVAPAPIALVPVAPAPSAPAPVAPGGAAASGVGAAGGPSSENSSLAPYRRMSSSSDCLSLLAEAALPLAPNLCTTRCSSNIFLRLICRMRSSMVARVTSR